MSTTEFKDMKQLTKEEAIAMASSGVWKDWTHKQRAEFQMLQQCLCMDFDAFHESLEETLGRPVWTPELGLSYEKIKAEVFNGAPSPSFEEILNLNRWTPSINIYQ